MITQELLDFIRERLYIGFVGGYDMSEDNSEYWVQQDVEKEIGSWSNVELLEKLIMYQEMMDDV